MQSLYFYMVTKMLVNKNTFYFSGYQNVGYQNVGDQNVGYQNVGYQNVGYQKSARPTTKSMSLQVVP